MAKENINGRMEVSILETGKRIRLKDMVNITGPQGESMKESGKTIRWMGKGPTNGKMEECTKASID